MMENAFLVDTRELTLELKKLGGRAQNQRAINAQVAEILRTFVDDKFQDEGPRWPQLAPATILRRRGGGQGARILQDTGILATTIGVDSGADFAEVFTNVEYARFHITGTRNMPQRDFFDIDETRALDLAARLITESIGRGR